MYNMYGCDPTTNSKARYNVPFHGSLLACLSKVLVFYKLYVI